MRWSDSLAFPTADGERRDNLVPDLEARVKGRSTFRTRCTITGTELDDFAYEFMATSVSIMFRFKPCAGENVMYMTYTALTPPCPRYMCRSLPINQDQCPSSRNFREIFLPQSAANYSGCSKCYRYMEGYQEHTLTFTITSSGFWILYKRF